MTTLCYYIPGQTHIVDAISPDNLTRYGRKSHQEILADYPTAQILTLEAAAVAIEALFVRPIAEITEEEYWEMVGVLPPVGFISRNGTSFKMSERTAGNITGIYANVGNRYFCLADSIFTPHDEIMRRVAEYIK